MSEGELTRAVERVGTPRVFAVPSDDIAVYPSGTVTLLFTDIEDSTRKWELDEDTMALVVAHHDDVLRGVIEGCGGTVFKTVGDAFHAVFNDAADAVIAAALVQRRVAEERWPMDTDLRVRCALNTGVCELRDNDYFGQMVNRCARLESIAHGGQVVMADATHALVVDRLSPDLTCVDLGPQQLKDLARPERVWQLSVEGLRSEFPPLESLSNPKLQTNIPAETSTFLGRADEVAQVGALLEQSRLLTIVGPGGVGKTRLALHAAIEQVDGSGDGVWFVDLAPLRDPQHVVGAVTRAIGVRDDPARDPIDHLVDACTDRNMLIVLDGCEHLVDAVAKVADQLLRHCPRVDILATSREPLRVHGEQRYELEPMSIPDGALELDRLGGVAAVELFVERARMQQPRFALSAENAAPIVQICRALDGIPLAIELAAARLDAMSLEALARRVEQPFTVLTGGARADQPRMQTLTALIDWSWDLLTSLEQVVLRRLSVVPGRFTLDSGAQLAARGDDLLVDDEASDVIISLVRKSLLRVHDDGRYSMLDMIRAYSASRLADDGDGARRFRHIVHRELCLEAAREASAQIPGPDQRAWSARIDGDYDNIVAAIDRAKGDDDVARGVDLVTALFEYWGSSGRSSYAVGALHELLDGGGEALEPALRCRALADLAAHEMRQGNYGAANLHAGDAISSARELGNDELLVRALTSVAFTEIGAIDDAVKCHEEALAVARRVGNDYLLARALQSLQFSESAAGRGDESVRSLEDERMVRARIGDAAGEALALSNLADEQLQRGDDNAAQRCLAEAFALLERHPSATVEAPARLNAGWADLGCGDRVGAAREFRRALDVARRAGLLSDVDYALLGLAQTADRAEDAVVLHGAADALLGARGEQLQPLESSRRDRDKRRLRASCGDDVFDRDYARGRELGRVDATAFALSVVPS
ncbi:MAG TPA: adenylate/guanylate cyclase domain-containing protein [Acidimicrobiia bacterium]